MNANLQRLAQIWQAAIPAEKIASVVEWGRLFVKLVGSALSENYNPDITPWTKEPLERTDDGTKEDVVVLPIQSGKSAIGEVGICRQIACANGGDIGYYWQNDTAADARWLKRVEKILLACEEVMRRTVAAKFKWKTGLVSFPHCNFIMQGVKTDRNVASDSIRFAIAEEVHDEQGGWEPGKLEQVRGRLTAYWNSFLGIISNAGYDGDQLHKAMLAGTMQRWEVKCPGCRLYHPMRTEWDPKHPELGGLRYDADGCRLENKEYDYFKLASTVRFQMPCGAIVRENERQRRALSLSGRYSEPRKGADLRKRSYTMEAVAIDYIPWLSLIQQKHAAKKALDYSDPEPYSVYMRERECRFWKRGLQPITQNIVLSSGIKKDSAGLPNREFRFGAGDYQQGEFKAGELPHWWHLIVDVETLPDGRVHLLIVSEGMITTDDDLVDTFARHGVLPTSICLDSSWNAPHVYQLCLKHGYTAVKGDNSGLYAGHPDGSRKVYSPPKPLHAMINQPPVHDYVYNYGELLPHPLEPMFIRYSQFGLLNRVAWLRSSKLVWLEVPGDVSEDFISHLDSWQIRKLPNKKTLVMEEQWGQCRDRDDLLMCLCYITLLMEDAGKIGAHAGPGPNQAEPGPNNEEEK
ncbi:MAG: Bacteriophage tail assembly protein [Pedosphaera sp.]|nr:Bacteriophage tail assembly protein [Pedosphaera sp.]